MNMQNPKKSRVFLATTALSEFWQTDRELLFLSSACLSYDKRDQWNSLNYRVMPCPWVDRTRFSDAAEYLEAFYEKVLGWLTAYLNNIHGVSYENRYWRIMLGPWLLVYLHAIYDRYTQLREALQAEPDLDTLVLDPDCFTVPKGVWDFMDLICEDAYNLQIYSQTLRSMDHEFAEKRLDTIWPESAAPQRANGRFPKRIIKGFGRLAIKFGEEALVRTMGHRRRIGLCDMYLPPASVWALAIRTGFRASPMGLKPDWSFTMPEAVFDAKRNGLAELDLGSVEPGSEFESIFIQSLPNNLPIIYLEGYQQARSEILERHPKFPPVIASLVGWYYDDAFKILAAEAMAQGTRLVAAQHGGTYGIHRYCTSETHERNIADSFMVWGWADDDQNICKNLPSPKISASLNGMDRKTSSNQNESVLFVNTSVPRYLIRFDSFPVGEQMDEYLDWMLRFLDTLPERVRRTISCRPHSVEHGWHVAERISEKFPSIGWDDGAPYQQSLKRSRIAVVDNPVTTYLETLVSNVPTVLFWNKEQWEIRDEAEPFFDELRSAGILHHSPEGAAEHVAGIYDKPQAWWKTEHVQSVRQRFIDRFAFGQEDWRGPWARALANV